MNSKIVIRATREIRRLATDALRTAERQRAEYADAEAKQYQDLCIWTDMDDDYGGWETSCGEAFCLVDGTPRENKMHFCPYCGRKLKEVRENETISSVFERNG